MDESASLLAAPSQAATRSSVGRSGRTPGTQGEASPPPRRRRHREVVLNQRSWMFLILPGAFIAASALYPFAQLLRMSVSNVGAQNVIGSWPFAGTANFHSVLGSAAFWQSMRTSGIFTGVLLVGDLSLGFITALWLTQPGRAVGVAQALMILGWALPPIVTGTAWKFLLQQNGFANNILSALGLGNVQWLSSTTVALWSLIGVVAWASVPFCAMLIKAGLLGIPRDTLEAARVDGAQDLQVIWRIVLPQLRSLLATLSVLIVVYGFGGSFSYIFVITAGGPGTVTTTLPFLGYVDAFTEFDFGIGAAIAVISMVVVGLLAFGYLRASGKEQSIL